MKYIFVGFMTFLFTAAYSGNGVTHFLVKRWLDKQGNNMCQYQNGTVLNTGSNTCPESIVD